jgi:hypothetical protein
MILRYLNWPKIPLELYPDVTRIITTNQDEIAKYTGESYDVYKFYPIDGELLDWLRNNIPVEFGAHMQCCHLHKMTGPIKMHVDENFERYKVNYIFTLGGDNVRTDFYDASQKNIIESNCVEALRWHQFDGQIHHKVWNIVPGEERLAITIGTNELFFDKFSC